MNVHSKLFRSAPLMVNYSLLGRPLLHNHQSIVNLSDEDLDAYVMGYHLKRAGNPNRRTKFDRLMSHIGCGML